MVNSTDDEQQPTIDTRLQITTETDDGEISLAETEIGNETKSTSRSVIKSIGALPNNMFNQLRVSSSTFRNRFLNPVSSEPQPPPPSSSSLTVDVNTDGLPSDPNESKLTDSIDHSTHKVTNPDEQGLLLDLTDSGNVPTINAGPSVHISTDETDSTKDLEPNENRSPSDDDSMPPPWITRKVSTSSKASMAGPTIFDRTSPTPTSIAGPIKAISVVSHTPAQPSRDSQSLLRAQLLKSQAQQSSRTDDTRQTQFTPNLASSSSHSNIISSESTTHRQPIMIRHDSNLTTPMLNPRKYYILTCAGKPVWSTEQDHDDKEGGDVTGLMGLMQAIISIFEDDGDELRYIDSGAVKIAVMLKPPLYLLAVSNWGEPESVLRLHLEYLYLLIQSILSLNQLHKMFERRQNCDLRRTLAGTDSIFHGMVDKLQWDFSIMMSSLEVFSCSQKIRNTIGRIVTPIPLSTGTGSNMKVSKPVRETKTERVEGMESDAEDENGLNLEEVARKLLYSIVLVHGKVACLVRPKKHSIHPSDLHLIITTVLSSSSLQSSESWVPICLPGYNSTGFLHAYITFLPAPLSHIGLVFVSGDRSGFFGLKRWAQQIIEHQIWYELGSKITGSNVDDHLNVSSSSQDKVGYSLEQVGIPGLRHFVYKHKTHVQVSFPIWEDDYLNLENRRRLMTMYQKAYDMMHPKLSRVKDDQRPPVTFLYLRNEAESLIAWNTTSHELYMAVSPMLSKAAAVSAAHSVVKWIKGQEETLFLTSAPAF